MLKDTFVAYVHPKIGAVREVMLMDREFEVENGVLSTGVRHGLMITNMTRYSDCYNLLSSSQG